MYDASGDYLPLRPRPTKASPSTPPDEPPEGLGAHLAPEQRKEGAPLALVGVLRDVVFGGPGAGHRGNVLGIFRRHAVDAVAARGAGALHLCCA